MSVTQCFASLGNRTAQQAADLTQMAASSSARAQQAGLVRRYFAQLTEGCGRRGCPNRLCFSCVDGPGKLDRTAAALRSLELAQGSEHQLCDEQPPFLHLELVRELVAEATRTGEWRPLEKEVSGVFSNANALNHSFAQSDAERLAAATELQVPVEGTSGLDADAVCVTYCELLRLQSSDIVAALMNATDSLLRTLQVAQLAQPSFVSDGAALRQFVILLLNPLLLEPQYHKQILLPLLSLVAALPPVRAAQAPASATACLDAPLKARLCHRVSEARA